MGEEMGPSGDDSSAKERVVRDGADVLPVLHHPSVSSTVDISDRDAVLLAAVVFFEERVS